MTCCLNWLTGKTRQPNTSFKTVCSVGSTFIAFVFVDVFEMGTKRLMEVVVVCVGVDVQCLPFTNPPHKPITKDYLRIFISTLEGRITLKWILNIMWKGVM